MDPHIPFAWHMAALAFALVVTACLAGIEALVRWVLRQWRGQ